MRLKQALIGMVLLLCGYAAQGQTYTFKCLTDPSTKDIRPDSCEGCAVWLIQSRSFDGLLIYKDSVPYRWIEIPYTLKVRSDTVDIWEHTSPPSYQGRNKFFPDRVSIRLSETNFATMQDFLDSAFCNALRLYQQDSTALFYASDSVNHAPVFRGDTLTIVGRDLAHVTYDSLLQKYVIQVDSVSSGATYTAGTGIAISGGNVISNTGDLSNTNEIQRLDTFAIVSNILRASLLNDGVPFSSVDLSPYVNVATDLTFTGSGPYTLNSSTGTDVTITQGAGITLTRTLNDLAIAAVDASTTNEIQTYAHTGTTSYTNTMSLGGGAFTLQAAGILAISHTAGTVTFTATEAQTANNGLSDNEAGGGIFRLGSWFMNSSDGLFGGTRKVNVNGNTLFIGDNTDSTLLAVFGATDKVGIHTTSASRTLHVNGEVRITDLVTTTTTLLVGTDANGDLQEVTIGSGISLIANVLSSSAAGFYQTFRDDGTPATQRAAANFVSTGRISTLLTDDAINGETEVSLDVVTNSIGNTQLRQGVARSVIGVTGNATANVADIQGTANQVLRINPGGTALAFGNIVPAAITVTANNTVIGNIAGATQNAQELTQANLYTLLGLTGVANRFALWTGTNTLASDAAFTFDGANDRATFTGTVAGTGAGTGILNLTTGTIAGATTFLSMRGTINSNLLAEMVNASTNSAGNSIFYVATVDGTGGDPYTEYQVTGAGGATFSVGIDNTTNRLMMSPGATIDAAGGNLVVKDDAGVTKVGVDNNNPIQPLTVEGRGRADLWMGEGNLYTSANVTFGTGAGTGPSVNSIRGTGNSVMVAFSTGTAPTASGNIFTITYPTSFPTLSMVTFSAGVDGGGAAGDNAANAIGAGLVKIETSGTTTFVFKSNGALTASTGYAFTFAFDGY